MRINGAAAAAAAARAVGAAVGDGGGWAAEPLDPFIRHCRAQHEQQVLGRTRRERRRCAARWRLKGRKHLPRVRETPQIGKRQRVRAQDGGAHLSALGGFARVGAVLGEPLSRN